MSPEPQTTGCLAAETLAAFAEGKLARHEMAPALAHLDRCAACRAALAAANELLPRPAADAARLPPWWLLAAAAALALCLLAVPLARWFGWPGAPPPTARLVELAPRTARLVEPRLAGGFPWAPYRGPARSTEASGDARQLRLAGAAGELVERADRDRSPAAQRAAGAALLLVEQPLAAVERLRAATARAPVDAAAWSDLAAAEYAAALRLGRASLYPQALAAADRALQAEPALPEALFNRALVLERLGLAAAAREAWESYLKVDPSSPWAAEARERAARLPATTSQSQFQDELPRLERAAAAGDQAAVDAVVDRHRQAARTFAEVEQLGRWAEAVQQGDASRAAGRLATARAIGGALVRLSGESLLAAAVGAIDGADPAGRAALAAAHAAYRRGRLAYSRHQPSAAEPDLRRAAAGFAAAGDPLALVARYYASETRFDQNDVAGTRAELEPLLAAADRAPRFAALGALVRWELALCLMTDDAWSAALPLVEESAAAFRRLGERGNLGFMQGMLGDVRFCLGRPDDAWEAYRESFALESAEGAGDRLAVSLAGTARMELRAGRLDTSRALLGLEAEAGRDAHNDSLLADALVRRAVLAARQGDAGEAASDAREAGAVAAGIGDPPLRARALVDVDLAAGAAALRDDPHRARELLAAAIDGYRRLAPIFLPDGYLLRAEADRRLGDLAAEARDVEGGVDALERHPVQFAGPVAGTGLFDAAALYGEAVRLWLDRGDVARAFAYEERSRPWPAAGVAAAGEPGERLAGSGVVLLEIAVLPAETVVFRLAPDGLAAARRPVGRDAVAALAARCAGGDDAAAGALYDLLIRPAERELAGASALLVVPDPLLANVSFAALRDAATGRYLVERLPVALASSAASLGAARPARLPESVAVLELPSGERERSVALPEAERELDEIGGLYPRRTALARGRPTLAALAAAAADADVVHLAGHTERQAGLGEAALAFAAPAGEGRDLVSWRAIAAAPLAHPAVVVLAACETLWTPRARQAFALSLGGGFLAAGAGDVVGTLAPVADNDARELFRAVHRELAAGAGAVEAVRRAQLAALAAEARGHRRTAWREIAVATRFVPTIHRT